MRAMQTGGRGVAVFLLAATLGGCYEHTVTVGAGAPRGPVVEDHWENFWIGGLIGHTRIDIARACPSGDATIVAKQTFLNGLVAGLTGGIYTPTTLQIRCRGGRRAAIELTADDVVLIVRDDRFRDWVERELPERLDAVDSARARLADR